MWNMGYLVVADRYAIRNDARTAAKFTRSLLRGSRKTCI